MTIQAATLAGASNNQDRYIVGDGFAAVLDGATSVAGDRSHDPGWYAEQLASEISERVPRDEPLAVVVAGAIQAVRDTNQLTRATTPTSTIALTRWTSHIVETYVLGDSYAVELHADGTEVIRTDDRLDDVATAERAAYRSRLADGFGYDDRHRDLLLRLQAEQARHCNAHGGYWIAGAEPEAAAHGITATGRRPEVAAILLASDGVALERHPEARNWRDLCHEAIAHGPARVIDRIQAAEASDPDGKRWPRSKRHDDKTLVVVEFERR